MKIIIDVIAVAVILGCALMAYKQGFVKTFFGLITVILAIILAGMFHKNLAAYIKANTGLDEFINSFVSGTISGATDKLEEQTAFKELRGMVASADFDLSKIGEVMEGAGVVASDFANSEFVNKIPAAISDKLNLGNLQEDFSSNLTMKISDATINILSWFIIYIVAQIVLSIVAAILNGLMILPFLREINNLAGLAIGVLLGFFRLYVVLAIVYFVSTIVNISFIVNAITSSSFVGALYNHNLILKLIF